MKTTLAQFEAFKASFLKYQALLGLQSWRIFFKHEKIDGDFARIVYDLSECAAIVTLNSEASKDEAPFLDPAKHGKHEAIHLLLATLSNLASRRYVQEREIDEADERLAILLTEVIP
jgi:hypothetical protein